MNQDWYRIAPLTFSYRATALQRDAVSNQIKSYYFGSEDIGDKTMNNLTNLYSDRNYCHCSRVGAMLHKKFNEGSPVYLYLFSYKVPMRSFLNVLNIHRSTGENAELYFDCPNLWRLLIYWNLELIINNYYINIQELHRETSYPTCFIWTLEQIISLCFLKSKV